ncbi:MAG: DUF4268 domain-containing protein [Patescibacteria group bacterium]
MYNINKKDHKLEPIEKISLRVVGIRERKDLQEWIAKNPEILGEELLIIQKEFDGFNDTNERLDLLALDKQGNLVVIENKLDDSGRDVVWQVLKYASYCSSLNSQNIKDVFNQYLINNGREGTAEKIFEEFFNNEDYEDKLNNGNSQRIIMVSGEFRKEATSTVLWLLNFGLRIQCFQASTHKLGDQLFFNIEQIIPMKGAEEYAISMANKNLDELSTQEELKNRHYKRLEFWTQFLREINKHNDLCSNVSPSRDSWISIAIGMGGVSLNIVISKNYARAEIYINRGDQNENKKFFDYFFNNKEKIEGEFGSSLIWERMDNKITSRIKCQLDGVNAHEKEDWDKINQFLIDVVERMEKVFKKQVRELRAQI